MSGRQFAWPAALSAGLVGLVGAAAWPFTVDDAYITARYGARLARGLGYTYNAGPATDGVTGPLWILPSLLGSAIGLDPIALSKALGIAAACAAAWVCVRSLTQRMGGRAAGWVAAVSLGTSLHVGVWAGSGLGTGLAALCATLFVLPTLREGRSPWVSGGAVAMCAWLRPELALAAGAALLWCVVRDRRRGSIAMAVASLGALALLVFRWVLFGALLPLSFWAKPGQLAHGWDYTTAGVLSVSSVVGLALLAALARWGQARDRALLAVLATHTLACVLAGGDWMPGLRLFVPLLPAYAAALGLAVVTVARRARRPWLVPVLALLACVWPVVELQRELPAVRHAGLRRDEVTPVMAAALSASPGPLAMLDIGAVGYRSQLPMVDLGGLVEPRVAHASGTHLNKRVDARWLRAQRPRWIVLHSASMPRVSQDGRLLSLRGYPVEQAVARMAWVRTEYRVVKVWAYSPDYFYVALQSTLPVAANRD